MIATQEKEIGGRVYRVTQLPPMRSLKLLNRLGKTIGPALARAGRAIGSPAPGKPFDLAQMEVDFGALGDAFQALFLELADDEQFERLLQNLLATTSLITDGKAIPVFGPNGSNTGAFDAVFEGRQGDVYKVAMFALEVNYSDFSGAIAALRQRFMAAVRPAAAAVASSGSET